MFMFFWGCLFLGGGDFKGEGWRFFFRCQIGCRVLGVRDQGIGKSRAKIRHEVRFLLRRWRVCISSGRVSCKVGKVQSKAGVFLVPSLFP